MRELGKLVATGKVTRIANGIGWGVFEDNEVGLETFDMPLSTVHHKVDDDVRWYHGEDDSCSALVIGDDYLSIMAMTQNGQGYSMEDGHIYDKSMNVVGQYEY